MFISHQGNENLNHNGVTIIHSPKWPTRHTQYQLLVRMWNKPDHLKSVPSGAIAGNNGLAAPIKAEDTHTLYMAQYSFSPEHTPQREVPQKTGSQRHYSQ